MVVIRGWEKEGEGGERGWNRVGERVDERVVR